MKQKLNNCDPTICDKDLMSWNGIFIDKEMIKECCECVNKSTCLAIVDLLKNNKKDEALSYADNIQRNK